MGQRVWKVKRRACPARDGEQRLSRAVRLLLEAVPSVALARGTGPGAACSQQPKGEEDTQEEGHDAENSAVCARVDLNMASIPPIRHPEVLRGPLR